MIRGAAEDSSTNQCSCCHGFPGREPRHKTSSQALTSRTARPNDLGRVRERVNQPLPRVRAHTFRVDAEAEVDGEARALGKDEKNDEEDRRQDAQLHQEQHLRRAAVVQAARVFRTCREQVPTEEREVSAPVPRSSREFPHGDTDHSSHWSWLGRGGALRQPPREFHKTKYSLHLPRDPLVQSESVLCASRVQGSHWFTGARGQCCQRL